MKHSKLTYNRSNILAVAFMITTLLWLTVSAPFVYAAAQQQDAYVQTSNTNDELPDSDDTPLGNTTEEKAETSISTLSEYLHHIDELSNLSVSSQQHNCSHHVAVYVAFHGEMLCPPPDTILS